MTRKPYVRPMTGWWRRDPFFMRYMGREATALGVAAYAIVLLVGVWRLSQGQAAFDAWLQALQNPLAIVFHLVLLVAMVYHTVSWFVIMPKTMPMLFAHGERLSPRAITAAGFAAAAVVSIGVIVLALGVRP